jgi:ubiquinone/menaquinone biosynthesis C-methylase UbiE
MMRTDIGEVSDVEAVTTLLKVTDLHLIDVGCGSGAISAELAKVGANVLGVEPDPVQAEKNRAANPVDNVTLIEGSAEALPAKDNSMDGVMFFRSLHHVPGNLMDKALNEAARVLKPDGFLYVVEPGVDGSHFKMMRPFHDETEVRDLAQQSLGRIADTLFEECEKYVYMLHPRHESFDAMADFHTAMSFNAITRDMVDVVEVRENFEAAATKDGYVFDQPILINLYRTKRR